jgi:hypothetical protein
LARRGRALAPATFASVTLLSVVVAVVMWSVGPSLISAPIPEIVTDASLSIDRLGDAVDRDLKVTIACQQRADARRRAAAQAQRRRTIERRDRVRVTAARSAPPGRQATPRYGTCSDLRAHARQRCVISAYSPPLASDPPGPVRVTPVDVRTLRPMLTP